MSTIDALLFASILACAGCGTSPAESPPEPQDAGPCAFDFALGSITQGGFESFEPGDKAPVVLGFQGFRFIDAAGRLAGIDANGADFRLRVTVAGHDPITQDSASTLVAGENDALVAEHVQIFFNDMPMVELIGRSASIEARAKVGDCTGDFAVTIALEEGGCMPADDAGAAEDGGDPCADAGL